MCAVTTVPLDSIDGYVHPAVIVWLLVATGFVNFALSYDGAKYGSGVLCYNASNWDSTIGITIKKCKKTCIHGIKYLLHDKPLSCKTDAQSNVESNIEERNPFLKPTKTNTVDSH